jgi:hypothetical protein
MGGNRFVSSAILGIDAAPVVIIMVMMLILLVLGMFLDWIGIALLTLPIFVPIVIQLGYDPIWFGILFAVNMQVSYLTPPFGPAAFYLKSVAPKEITLKHIYTAAAAVHRPAAGGARHHPVLPAHRHLGGELSSGRHDRPGPTTTAGAFGDEFRGASGHGETEPGRKSPDPERWRSRPPRRYSIVAHGRKRWLGYLDSNQGWRYQKPLPYRLAIPQHLSRTGGSSVRRKPVTPGSIGGIANDASDHKRRNCPRTRILPHKKTARPVAARVSDFPVSRPQAARRSVSTVSGGTGWQSASRQEPRLRQGRP